MTPFSARALDRGFAGALVALARHVAPALEPPLGVEQLADVRVGLEQRLRELFDRACASSRCDEDERAAAGRAACRSGSSTCSTPGRRSSTTTSTTSIDLQYQRYEGPDTPKPLLREMLDTDFESEHHRKFRVNRSLRDVEPR